MKVVVAIDSLKGSLSTTEAGEAIARGVKNALPEAEVAVSPMADGGEGTVDAIVSATKGTLRRVTVSDALGRATEATYGLLPDGKTAVMEMAAAAGLPQLRPEERNPARTTTFGVGEMILDALSLGYRHFIVGIGGSATNDGGAGMLEALGARFLRADGTPVPRGCAGLAEICDISLDGMHPALAKCRFEVACDVKNPLCGATGCSAVYAPQKGATPEMIPVLDAAVAHFAAKTAAVLPNADADFPGAGAAGGLGFAFLAYLGAALVSGVELVMRETGLEALVREADVVVTGEGRLDGQSVMGKAPVGVATLAKRYGKPVVAFSGCVTPEATRCNDHGIDAFFPILRAPCTLAEAMKTENAAANMTAAAEQAFRLIAAFRR
ncbi:MAG: glycerate kinase [Ruminococcaceae bacterium]|nr:glycerate kinase [Oscillospiraceae bacterium]